MVGAVTVARACKFFLIILQCLCNCLIALSLTFRVEMANGSRCNDLSGYFNFSAARESWNVGLSRAVAEEHQGFQAQNKFGRLSLCFLI